MYLQDLMLLLIEQLMMPLGPNLLEGFGKAPKDARDSSRAGLTRSAFILVMNCARHGVAAVLDVPSPQFAV